MHPTSCEMPKSPINKAANISMWNNELVIVIRFAFKKRPGYYRQIRYLHFHCSLWITWLVLAFTLFLFSGSCELYSQFVFFSLYLSLSFNVLCLNVWKGFLVVLSYVFFLLFHRLVLRQTRSVHLLNRLFLDSSMIVFVRLNVRGFI